MYVYASSSFLDLITDENFNRTVLRWLKEFKNRAQHQKEVRSSMLNGSSASVLEDTRRPATRVSPFTMTKLDAAPEMTKLGSVCIRF